MHTMKIGTDGSLRSCRFSFVPARRPAGGLPASTRGGSFAAAPVGLYGGRGTLRFPGAGRWSCRSFSLRGGAGGGGSLLRSSVRGPAVFFEGSVSRMLCCVWRCVWAAASAGRCYGRYVVVCVGAGPAVFFGGSASRMPCRVRRCVGCCFGWAVLRTICCDVRRCEDLQFRA